jgi:hypothetical protein
MLNLKLIPVFLFLFFTTNLIAQKGANELKLDALANFPIGHFGDGFKTGFGIGATDYIPTSKTGSFLIHVSYNSFKTKSGNITYTGSIVPILAGYRYKKEPLGFYFQGAIGGAIYGNVFGSGVKFAFSPGAGYLIKAGNKGAVDLCLNFNSASYGGVSNNWIALGLGYYF